MTWNVRRLEQGAQRASRKNLKKRPLATWRHDVRICAILLQQPEKERSRQVLFITDQHEPADHDHRVGPFGPNLPDGRRKNVVVSHIE